MQGSSLKMWRWCIGLWGGCVRGSTIWDPLAWGGSLSGILLEGFPFVGEPSERISEGEDSCL